MRIQPLFLIVSLLLLAACGGSAYNRSYIISDGMDAEVTSEEKR